MLHIILVSKPVRKLYSRLLPWNLPPVHIHPTETYDSYQVGFFAEVKEHITRHGGSILFAYKVARLAGCLIFSVLCLATLVQENDTESHQFGKWGKKPKKKHGGRSEISEWEWLQISMSISAVCYFIHQFLPQLSKDWTVVCFVARSDIRLGEASVE